MKKIHVQFTRSMLVLALAGSMLLSGCQMGGGYAVQIDPPSYEWHGDCGRGLTGILSPVQRVQISVQGLAPGEQAEIEGRNDLNPSFGPYNSFSNPSTASMDPAVAGFWHFQASIQQSGGTTVTVGPVDYTVPLFVEFKAEKTADGQVRLRAVTTGGDAPWTFGYAFCARPADAADSSTDQWRSNDPQDTWDVPGPITGRWTFYVLVTAIQDGYTSSAASGEQIILNADIDTCRIGTGC